MFSETCPSELALRKKGSSELDSAFTHSSAAGEWLCHGLWKQAAGEATASRLRAARRSWADRARRMTARSGAVGVDRGRHSLHRPSSSAALSMTVSTPANYGASWEQLGES